MSSASWIDFYAGWIGGCAGLLAGHPLDTIKVRQQTLANTTALKGILNTFKYEGVRGFYKGMGFPLLATGTLNSIFFGVYGEALRRLKADKQRADYKDVFLAGCFGGIFQLSVACPVELVKIKMQVQTNGGTDAWGSDSKGKSSMKILKTNYSGPTQCLADLYKSKGLRGCYFGLGSMAVRDVPSFGLYMVIYEIFIRNLHAGEERTAPAHALLLSGGMADVPASVAYFLIFEYLSDCRRDLPAYKTAFYGGVAGALSWMLIVPFDVVKSRIQADDINNRQYKSMWDCCVKSVQKEGLSVFSRGFSMVILRAFPTNAAIFLAYVTSMNMMSQWMGKREQENESTKVLETATGTVI